MRRLCVGPPGRQGPADPGSDRTRHRAGPPTYRGAWTQDEPAGRIPARPPGAGRPGGRRAACRRGAPACRAAPRGGGDARRASAPTTTCGWSRAATATRRRRCSRRWPGCSGWTRRRREYLLSLSRRVAAGGRGAAGAGAGRHPAAARRARPAGVRARTASSTCWPRTGWRPRCRRRSGRGKTGCARCSRPGRAGAVPGLGGRRWQAWWRRSAPTRRRRDDPRCGAGRRAVAGQRAVPPAVGASRRRRGGRAGRLRHPEVGDLELRREKLSIGGTDGQLLVIYHAEPGRRPRARWRCSARSPPAPGTTPRTVSDPVTRPGSTRRSELNWVGMCS